MLYLDPKRRQWVIRDGPRFIRTGCGEGDSGEAEKCLAQYIGHKHKPKPSGAPMIADVLNVYGLEVAAHKKSARNIAYCIGSLLNWWGIKTAADISTRTCREYASTKTPAAAGADLKVLRAAVGHWHREHGPLTVVPSFWMPPEGQPRQRWLTRLEVARLLWAARHVQHIKRLILLGIYTGSRPGVICWTCLAAHR